MTVHSDDKDMLMSCEMAGGHDMKFKLQLNLAYLT